MRKLVFLVLMLTLAACSVSVEQMASEGDWFDIGYRDAIRGHNQRSLKELASLGSVKQSEYDQGYLSGISEYCNPDVAYQIGLTGQYYEGVCEGTSEAQKFRMEWKRGWDEHANEYY
ncbi:DUF2799 domain-containing protein [Vibrio ostreicida]|uniref:DUF2799 domain-containing protein n=1 Tax=Vibrio ostreicida TaxID=526588 RepID=A0ABT8BXU8_9VIBR|nr:DUF2799 domain-containing protein [Vibrio ostreicida]MDN3610898.1 DUF2799 domain-containing protein [Vibrio ostreicida]NPD10480.1 DUF2799 domain-containing protein [Vibrio ostreicida]